MANLPHEALDGLLASYQTASRRESRKQTERASGPAWTRFAAAAGASLAAVSTAEGAIQYTDLSNSPIRVGIYDPVRYAGIDIDGVGGNDLAIAMDVIPRYYNTSNYSGLQIFGSLYPVGAASVIGNNIYQGPLGTGLVRRFYSGGAIPAQTPAVQGSLLAASQTAYNAFSNPVTSAGFFGIFNGSVTGYAGFVKNNGGNLHAGWIKIRTERFNFLGLQRLGAVEVLGWAYEDTAGASIMAGQTESAGLPGDYNNDGTVDAADYTVWRDHLGQTFQLDNEDPGDTNPGVVDQDDYEFWVSQFGNSGSASVAGTAGAVPEPTTIGLGALALGAAGVAALRRRRD